MLGGAIYVDDDTDDAADATRDGGFATWFVNTHGTRTPAYMWKLVVAAQGLVGASSSGVIAVFMNNTAAATSASIDEWVVSVAELERRLAAHGAAEVFDLADAIKQHAPTSYWDRPSGCSTA